MDFSDAVQWWEEWQLRILVLSSLFIQCFLLFADVFRKCSVPSWFRFMIWLGYLGNDAVAIYALATLFNRNTKEGWVSTHKSSATLQALWAPILLIHLGGQDAISAYNIEDNELWRRHVLTAGSQVAVAIYVFCKSWLGDKRILAAAIPLFFVGILKCLLKPWDLKRASINSLVDSALPEENSKISSLDEYVRAARVYFQADNRCSRSASPEGIQKPYNLFVDLAPSYSARFRFLKLVAHLQEPHRFIQSCLSLMFDRLYTKETMCGFLFASRYRKEFSKEFSRFPCLGFGFCRHLLGMVLLMSLLLIGLCIKLASYHDLILSYSSTDVNITIVLILFTCLLDMIRTIVYPFVKALELISKGEWPDQVAQYNLIGYLARNQRHRTIRKLATLLVCKDYLDKLWCMKPCKSSCNITELVHGYIKTGWQQMNGIPSYRRFNDNRGQWTLEHEGLLNTLGWSLRRPFDESVLLWHLATDFCFHHMDMPPDHEAARRSREMSNYMVYLLFVNPEMLIPGARPNLFRDAYNKLKDIPLYERSPLDVKELAQNVIHRVMGGERSGVVHDAWAIAQELIMLYREEEAKIWRVIQGVWVEMLCFSAGRCRGYLHAKSLGKGGEYLSYVWLLLLYMGMETLAERMQRMDVQEERDEGGSVVSPRSTSPMTATEEIMFDKRRGAFDISVI